MGKESKEVIIVIDGIKYVKEKPQDEKLRLLIVDNRGLTFVGYCDLSGDNEIITIRDARCVISWGTSEHIAQLVDGPVNDKKNKTQLGRKHDVDVFRKNLIISYLLNQEKWPMYNE